MGDAPPHEMGQIQGEGAFARQADRSAHFSTSHLWPIATHEAGHAVVALLLGWMITSCGVDISSRFASGHGRPPGPSFNHEDVVILLAGPLAEGWLRRHIWRPESDYLRFHIEAARAGERRSCDNCRAFAAIFEGEPGASDATALAFYRHFEKRAIDLVTRPDVFSTIQTVARELHKDRIMQDEDIRRLIPPDLLPGGCHAPMWTSMGYSEDLIRVALPRV
ncbi:MULTISPECIES: hypothetical protein [unclassified Chelatococcus]|uniref:hypothetical protein n=1 Tax=unclassified Chelatococcus TaxID=2638111 RepID=UPI001BCFE57F|nr:MULTISPECIES: hypothetical protein [unclassified Chelatococcus]MBS7696235.1 hypothetical protein [Chelatococcus sp. YT9]MBS7697572.1 hypothetical protein [Chelatococcus sp. YT9]MBX3560119.1 hypothetical protein [Chelatococcus sp.]